jgi:hypothetical protein
VVPARRLPRVPWWAVALVAGWALLVGMFELIGPTGPGATLCLVRRVTSVPCPTCGSTRAARAIFAGQPLDGLRHNPLVVLAGAAVVVVLVIRVGLARRLEVHLGRGARRVAWIVAALALVANWAYVIARHVG